MVIMDGWHRVTTTYTSQKLPHVVQRLQLDARSVKEETIKREMPG